MKTRKRLPALSLSFLLRQRQRATAALIPKEPSCQSLYIHVLHNPMKVAC
jgi:hypothetical protein